ncbi:cell division protein FtsA [Pontibacter sp. G13]|uniref:cell division protein FtsA n=1 Tax=Pontibacter sp. G13 TaxID=3074898 RepID=UPI00288A4789|nr:cell division protein FtsA [Pontibacter sp. G13]WNJ20050.1 cell division protein FtsA [Pontibacter sp. G13]
MSVNQGYKVLRLFKGSDTGEDWHPRNSAYSPNEINKIKDPEGSNPNKEITSIPSPFARIHLFEQAFRHVSSLAKNDPDAVDGDTMFHRLVSDSLDVGEIFFKYDLFSKRKSLNVMHWNMKKHLAELKESDYPSHQLLGETFELFLKQDGKDLNLDRIEHMHFLYVDHEIVGGTSPTTLFFTSGNDLGFVGLKAGTDILLDDEYCPLYKRSDDFQLYLYGLFAAYKDLRQGMPLVYSYLDASLAKLKSYNKPLFDQIKAIEGNQQYSAENLRATFDSWPGDQSVTIWEGMEHLKMSTEIKGDLKSDFLIHPSKAITHKVLPMALQNELKHSHLEYYHGKWNPEIQVPPYNDAPLLERFLPGQDIQYPYLTISDFLEPYLIELPFALDPIHFFDGNLKGFNVGDKASDDAPDDTFLLPIKRAYFDYFSLSDLLNKTTRDGKPYFRMVKVGETGVRVELRIPIQEGKAYVEFSRVYYQDREPEEDKNRGSILKAKFNVGFLPFFQHEGTNQRVGLSEADSPDGAESEYQISFIKDSDAGTKVLSLGAESPRVRSSQKLKHDHLGTTQYFLVPSPYDMLEISPNASAKGLLIPRFRGSKAGSKKFSFAVDFGTTNTHIEYSIDGGNPQPFVIDQPDQQLIMMFDRAFPPVFDRQLETLLLREMIPYEVGGHTKFGFPIRTASSEIVGLDHRGVVLPIADANIAFAYERETIMASEQVTTNLKWQKTKGDKGIPNRNRVEVFLHTLMIMIRNKVLQNGGNLADTEIVWFFPSSMSGYLQGLYTKIWKEAFQKHIHPDKEPIAFSESEAPFYNHDRNKVKSNVYPVVNIDIGGGTTDIVIFEKDHPTLSTSIKFAGNAVFGDGYSEQYSDGNGFVQTLKPIVESFFQANGDSLYQLNEVFSQFKDSNSTSSSDMMAFFFSLEANKELEDKSLKIRISDHLREDEQMNFIYMLFVGGILYHVAKLMKTSGKKMPRNICFSGNGSKIINLLDATPKLKKLEKLTKLMFERVYGKEYHSDGLDLIQGPKPKEATCKGGILRLRKLKSQEVVDYDRIAMIGDGTMRFVNSNKVQLIGENLKYHDVDDDIKANVLTEVEDFWDFLFELHSDFSFLDNFGVDISGFTEIKGILKRDMLSNLEQGLSDRLELTDPSQKIEESLFFYPLIGSMYNLGIHIAEQEES